MDKVPGSGELHYTDWSKLDPATFAPGVTVQVDTNQGQYCVKAEFSSSEIVFKDEDCSNSNRMICEINCFDLGKLDPKPDEISLKKLSRFLIPNFFHQSPSMAAMVSPISHCKVLFPWEICGTGITSFLRTMPAFYPPAPDRKRFRRN